MEAVGTHKANCFFYELLLILRFNKIDKQGKSNRINQGVANGRLDESK